MSDDKKQVSFYEFFQPPMEAGEYIVSVAQQVSSDNVSNPFDETFSTTLTFAVQGVRFSLSPSYVQEVFPPDSQQGEYGNVLPHVVLNAKTLPWQRDLGISEDGVQYPWLAVLVFDELDPPPLLQSGTLADFKISGDTISYPFFEPGFGQQLTDPCNYIDVDAKLFTAIVPRSTEMRWLSSARIVSEEALRNRALSAGDTALGETAIVAGNRLAVAGRKTTCYLVSLESMGSYLPDRDGLPEGTKAVRMAVLSFWSFASIKQEVDFKDYLTKLDIAPASLQIPYQNALGTPNPDVKEALSLGYTLLPYHTRQGADICSWYRGPLLPFGDTGTVSVPVSSQDALTNYNPETGLPDTSLSNAWQLGRLLALQDLNFATNLYNWKRSQDQAAVNEFEQKIISSHLGIEHKKGPEHSSVFHRKLMEALKPALNEMINKYQKEK